MVFLTVFDILVSERTLESFNFYYIHNMIRLFFALFVVTTWLLSSVALSYQWSGAPQIQEYTNLWACSSWENILYTVQCPDDIQAIYTLVTSHQSIHKRLHQILKDENLNMAQKKNILLEKSEKIHTLLERWTYNHAETTLISSMMYFLDVYLYRRTDISNLDLQYKNPDTYVINMKDFVPLVCKTKLDIYGKYDCPTIHSAIHDQKKWDLYGYAQKICMLDIPSNPFQVDCTVLEKRKDIDNKATLLQADKTIQRTDWNLSFAVRAVGYDKKPLATGIGTTDEHSDYRIVWYYTSPFKNTYTRDDLVFINYFNPETWTAEFNTQHLYINNATNGNTVPTQTFEVALLCAYCDWSPNPFDIEFGGWDQYAVIDTATYTVVDID